jgi:hypothetical protein
MKKIKITEKQLHKILKSNLVEDLMNMNNQQGAVEISKDNVNTNDIKKFTSQGVDVKLVEDIDEKIGDEQDVKIKHKFSDDGSLKIFSTRDKVTLRDILSYIDSIKKKQSVDEAFKNGEVKLYVKIPSSGKYTLLGDITPNALEEFRKIKDSKKETKEDSMELNEQISKFLIK